MNFDKFSKIEFVTLDKKHFLQNKALKTAVSFPVGMPGDCLAWYKNVLLE